MLALLIIKNQYIQETLHQPEVSICDIIALVDVFISDIGETVVLVWTKWFEVFQTSSFARVCGEPIRLTSSWRDTTSESCHEDVELYFDEIR